MSFQVNFKFSIIESSISEDRRAQLQDEIMLWQHKNQVSCFCFARSQDIRQGPHPEQIVVLGP
jgi:hypothetical protein